MDQNINKSKLVLLLACLLAIPCFSLSWQEAKDLTQKNNNELIVSQKQLDNAKWKYNRSFTPFLPQVSFSSGMTESLSATTDASSRSYSYGLSASQTLFSGTDNFFSMQAAYASWKYYEFYYAKTSADIIYRLRSAYAGLAVAKEQVDLQKQILELRKNNEALLQMLYQSGKEDRGNYLQAQADLLDAQYNLEAAKRDYDLAKLKLSQLIGAQILSQPMELSPSLPSAYDRDALVAIAPDIIMSKYQLESALAGKRDSAKGFLPSVSLSGSMRNTGSVWPPTLESKSWSLSLSYNLFPGGSNIADTILANINYDTAYENLLQKQKDVTYSISSARTNLENALELVKVRQLQLEAANERAKISKAKYLNGLIDYDEWERMENSFVSAQKSLLSQKLSALNAEAAYYNSYGGSI